MPRNASGGCTLWDRHYTYTTTSTTRDYFPGCSPPGGASQIGSSCAATDANGAVVELTQLLGQGPVVLIFYRGGWCPFCNVHLRAFQLARPQLRALGTQVVLISANSEPEFRRKALDLGAADYLPKTAGAKAIISAGLAGGVDPARETGALIVGERVVTPGGEVFKSDERLLIAADAQSAHAVILGSDEILKSVAEKENAFRRYAACCVDMESHGAARAAFAANAPFIAVRAIADSSSRTLPAAAQNAIAPDGSVRVFSVFANCLKQPEQFEQIFALGRDSEAAHDALRRDFGRLFGAFLVALDL